MPSPFPGMDPYLESDLWTPFHSYLATGIAHHLVPMLRPKYIAFPTERFYLDVPEDVAIEMRSMSPDVATVYEGKSKGNGATMTISPSPLRLATIVPVPVPHVSIEIRDVKNRRLVTAIEILSPTNKGGGRERYLRKRRTLLLSKAHLIEIDLLRDGMRVPMRKPLPPCPYFVLLSRVETRPIMEVWPIELTMSLPKFPVPLFKKDADVELDLQAVMNEMYDRGGYDAVIDYTQSPDVPLLPKMAAWANKLLRAAKLR